MTHELGTQLTASRIELASKCPGSQVHEHVQTTNDAAERGTAIHDYIACLLSRGEASLPSNHEAHAVCERLDKDEILRTALPGSGANYRVELGLYLSPASGETGILDGSHHRDYSEAPQGSIPGTADVVALEENRVRVTDWKTGCATRKSLERSGPYGPRIVFDPVVIRHMRDR
jgi:ATP-dependent exoDNAse (exonuclease V) beta subunit